MSSGQGDTVEGGPASQEGPILRALQQLKAWEIRIMNSHDVLSMYGGAEGVALIPIWRGNMNNRILSGWVLYCHTGPDFFGGILSLLFHGQPAQGKIPARKDTALRPDLIIT